MLPKSLRLTERYDYNKVKRFGRACHTPLFSLSSIKDFKNTQKPSRFGLIVTNRIDKRATERHRLKRLINKFLYEHLSSFGKGFLIVVVAKPLIVGKKYEEISAEFNKVLSKVSFSG